MEKLQIIVWLRQPTFGLVTELHPQTNNRKKVIKPIWHIGDGIWNLKPNEY